jgi:hypothetical protein
MRQERFLKLKDFFLKQTTTIAIYLTVTILASLHLFFLPNNTFGGNYTHYNNFLIFKFSFWHLINGQDLYINHLVDHYDLFKYSPSFALFMAPFAILPNWLGLVLWNLVSVGLLLISINRLQFFSFNQKIVALYIVFLETLTSLQSAQTNVIMVSLFLFALSFFEDNKPHWASLMLMLSVFIKIFGLILFPLFLLYKHKGKFVLFSVLWFLMLIFLPLVVINFNQLLFLYESWWNLLQNDHSVSFGLSVMGWLNSWFGFEPNKFWIVVAGFMILMLSILYSIKTGIPNQRPLLFASGCIWVIIFNHKAESSTFNIAMVGVAIYYLTLPNTTLKNALFIFCFLFTCLSPTDLFPQYVRANIVTPYVLKAVPCIFIWIHINYYIFKIGYKTSL